MSRTRITHPVIDFHGPSRHSGERLKALTNQNKATCVKAVDGAGWAFEAAQLRRETGVPHTILYRQTAPGGLGDDHPNLHKTPHEAAAELWAAVKRTMPSELRPFKDIIYIEPTNEPGVVTEKPDQARWVGQFCVDIAKMMLAEGWNPALAGFNAGTPSPAFIRAYFVDLLKLFAEVPDRCLWTLHEAKLGGFRQGLDYKTQGLTPFVPYLINSSQQVFAVCDELGIARPRTFISEFAWSHNDIPDEAQFRREVDEAARMDAQWPEVVGRTIYTTHSGGPMWRKLFNKLNGQSDWLTEYVTTTTITAEIASPAPESVREASDVQPQVALDAKAAGFQASINLDNVQPGESFEATWTFCNSGQIAWKGDFRLAVSEEAHAQTQSVEGKLALARPSMTLSELGAGSVPPGTEVSLTLKLTAPEVGGLVALNLQLQDANGLPFGPVRWVRAVVGDGSQGIVKSLGNDYELELGRGQPDVVNLNELMPGQRFTVTWHLRNRGLLPWVGSFVWQPLAGNPAEAFSLKELTGQEDVAPGEQIAIALPLTAPLESGDFEWGWQLISAEGDALEPSAVLTGSVIELDEPLVEKSLSAIMSPVHATYKSYQTDVAHLATVPAGTPFSSRWTFVNSGTVAWGEGFTLAYVPRGTTPDPMMAETSFALADVARPSQPQPGEKVEITLNFTAPDRVGRQVRSFWQLRDPRGNAFAHIYEEITIAPAPTVGTGARSAEMDFVADVSVPDGSRFPAGTEFVKQWRVRNSGNRQWGKGFRLLFVEGDLAMARGQVAHLVPEAKPGEEVVLSVPMTAPPVRSGSATQFRSSWRLQDDRGMAFGDVVWADMVSISAVGAGSSAGGSQPTGSPLATLLNDRSLWYSQRDPAWANQTLGTGSAPMKTWGCLLTCMAMAISANGHRLNPAELNSAVTRIGSRAIVGSNVMFIAPALVLPGLVQGANLKSWPDSPVQWAVWKPDVHPLTRINEALARGEVVLAQVDTQPNNGYYDGNVEQHWVVIVGVTAEGDDYLILDPITPSHHRDSQPSSLMAKYGRGRPGDSAETNLRNAIKSTLVYYKRTGKGG